jgi:methylated-DNA-[protein]-cysteine S-methyltransferase
MSSCGYTLFDTPVGRCAMAWGASGICGVQLPESTDAATRAQLQRRLPEALPAEPPAYVQDVMARVVAMLNGRPVTFNDVQLDMTGVPPFNQRVYEVALAIPAGRTLTYGDIAQRLGQPGAARAVGQALGHNPFAPVVPCHRVLAAGSRSGGFSARGGVSTKLRMLLMEGAAFGEPGLFDAAP